MKGVPLSRHDRVPETCTSNAGVRKGFTLIEVVVALSILVIVVLALNASYFGFYASVQNERYKTLGENLAQLQLEDIQGLPVSVLRGIVGEGKDGGLGYYPYFPDSANPLDVLWQSDNYKDIDADEHIFDSGQVPGEFRVYRLEDVGDLSGETIAGIGLETVSGTDPVLHDVVLYSSVSPGYQRRVVITDKTPTVSVDARKLFEISVTVYWTSNNVVKSVTVTGLKNDLGST